MRVYVLGGEICTMDIENQTTRKRQQVLGIVPKLGAGWQVAIDFPGTLEGLHDRVTTPIGNLTSDYGVVHKRYISTDTHFGIIQGYRWNSGELEQDLLFTNVHAMDQQFRLSKLEGQYPVQLFGPPGIESLSWLPSGWEPQPQEVLCDPESPIVLGVWAPADTKVTKEDTLRALHDWITERGGVRHIVVGMGTTPEQVGGTFACRYSIPMTYITPRTAFRDLYHAAAADVVTNPEVVTPLFERVTDLLCFVDSEDHIPPIFRRSEARPIHCHPVMPIHK